jgi:hypothetical protein
MQPDTATLENLGTLAQRLEVVDAGDQRTVFLNGHAAARYDCDDKVAERVLITQLAEVVPLPDRQIALTFQIHPVTLSRFRAMARSGGTAALVPSKSGPKGPSKMTPKIEACCRALRQQGLSFRAIAGRVSTGRVRISHVTVAGLFQEPSAPPPPETLPLPLDTPSPETPLPAPAVGAEPPRSLESPRADFDPPATEKTEPPAGESQPSRYAGAMILYAALARLGVWDILAKLGANAGPSRRFGWAQTVASIVFCFALRFRSVEDWKNGLRRDLGVLIGESSAPSVLTMRTKIKAVAESLDPVAFSRDMLQRYVALEPVWEGLYYVDGYFCPYYGQHPTPKGWDGKRRLAAKGHTDVYLHDAKGRVLFFFSQPLNDSLARALPAAVAEIRRVHGEQPFTLVFDRGGYSGDAFRFLQAEGIGFITYLKGRSARRQYPAQRFRGGWFAFEGQRHSYRLWEKKTRLKAVGRMRTILFLGDDGQQIPVLTNLAASARAAKVVHCLRLRWRQENSFKFLSEHYAIDQILQYGATPEARDRLVPNPKRKALKEQVRTLGKQIQSLEAELGRALEDNHEGRRRTTRGLKIAQADLRHRIAQQRQALSRLDNRLRHTPGQISAQQVDKQRALLREDRRLLVNAFKLVTANAERMLALQFNRVYECPKDAFSIFRGLLQLPGIVRRLGPDCVEIVLERPDSDKVANALETLLTELNTQQPRMLASGPVLVFRLTDVNISQSPI